MPKNIVGSSFDYYVIDQINTRQQKLGLGLRDLDVVKFENTNTPFIRLTSGVNVSGDVIKNALDLQDTTYDTNKLAKQFQLFSARTQEQYNKIGNNGTLETATRGTFTHGYGYSPVSSYGFMSDSSYGLVPPPGITSIDIRALNRGSLREANIRITCHNLQQFQIIELLYMRLKYSILLEWGHSVYWTNQTKKIKVQDPATKKTILVPQAVTPELVNASSHTVVDAFLEGKADQQGILDLILQERENTFGNYDAFFGLVTNFEWTLRPDGGYEITVTARSTGDLIESLKINTNYPYTSPVITSSAQPTTTQTNKDATTINRILYSITQNVLASPFTRAYAHGVDFGYNYRDNVPPDGTLAAPIHNYNLEWLVGEKEKSIKAVFNRDKAYDKETPHLTTNEAHAFIFEHLNSGFVSNGVNGVQYYIKLGTLMRILESFLLYYDKSKGDDGERPPLFKIDYDYNNNFCFTFPRHCSVDPKVCLIPVAATSSAVGQGISYIETTGTYYEIYEAKSRTDKLLEIKGGIPGFETTLVTNPSAILANGTDNVTWLPPAFGLDPYPELSNTNVLSYVAAEFTNWEFTYNDGSVTNQLKDVINNNPKILVGWKDEGRTPPSPDYKYYKVDILAYSNQDNTPFVSSNFTEITQTEYDQLFLFNAANAGTNLIRFQPIKAYAKKKQYILRSYTDTAQNFRPNNTGNDIYDIVNQSKFKTPGKGNEFIGNTMHIHVNLECISSVLDDEVNIATGELSLYSFLEKLMVKIQYALGNVNSFQVTHDEDNNSYKIIDNTQVPGLNKYRNDYFENGIVQFNANLLKPNNGSFVTNINFKTKLSNNFATMVTIGAQANGNAVGENSTALSRWNVGLTDRIITDKVNENDNNLATNVATAYINNINSLIEYNTRVNNGTVTDTDIEAFRGAVVDLFNAEVGEFTRKGDITGIGFIPFDLELEMLGLSGARIYESYTIDTTLLPKSYQDKIQFICTGVSHRVDENGWKTTLNSICGPRVGDVVPPPAVNNYKRIDVPRNNNNNTNRGDLFSWVKGPNASPDQNWSDTAYMVNILRSSTISDDLIAKPRIPLQIKSGYPQTQNYNERDVVVTKYETTSFTSAENEQMFKDILTKIGAPTTAGNILWMRAWRKAEGGDATYNPWNSTQVKGTANNYNKNGVQNYFNLNDGVDATVTTLTNGRYPTILKALKAGLTDKNEALELAKLTQQYDMTGLVPAKWQ
jgi:hypothetical protein